MDSCRMCPVNSGLLESSLGPRTQSFQGHRTPVGEVLPCASNLEGITLQEGLCFSFLGLSSGGSSHCEHPTTAWLFLTSVGPPNRTLSLTITAVRAASIAYALQTFTHLSASLFCTPYLLSATPPCSPLLHPPFALPPSQLVCLSRKGSPDEWSESTDQRRMSESPVGRRGIRLSSWAWERTGEERKYHTPNWSEVQCRGCPPPRVREREATRDSRQHCTARRRGISGCA